MLQIEESYPLHEAKLSHCRYDVRCDIHGGMSACVANEIVGRGGGVLAGGT